MSRTYEVEITRAWMLTEQVRTEAYVAAEPAAVVELAGAP